MILKENIVVLQNLVNNKQQLLEEHKLLRILKMNDANQILVYAGFHSYRMLIAFIFLDQLPMHYNILVRQVMY